ncbi:MAG: helix-turn-helix transcriptional regulator [Burkholderiales bacterium]|nr:helix-turn-helix transcriptional regulator [Burkholderiales bacterium]
MIVDLGFKIKSMRLDRKMTLEGLAKKAGTVKSHIWELENNRVTNPSVFMIKKIDDSFNVSIDTLISGDNGYGIRPSLINDLKLLRHDEFDIVVKITESFRKNAAQKIEPTPTTTQKAAS